MDWLSILSGLGQTGMGIYQGFGGGYNDPTKNAKNTLGKIPGQVQPYYSPYMNAGKGALEDLQNQNKGLLSGTTQNTLGASYKESPGYQARLKEAMNIGANQSARGGMTGTPSDTENLIGINDKLSKEDYNNYMTNQLGLYNTGYAGEQGLNNQGFEANKGYADTLANVTGQQAGLDYAGDAGKNTYKQGGWENAFKGLGQTAGTLNGMPPWLLEAIKHFSGGAGGGGQSNQTA